MFVNELDEHSDFTLSTLFAYEHSEHGDFALSTPFPNEQYGHNDHNVWHEDHFFKPQAPPYIVCFVSNSIDTSITIVLFLSLTILIPLNLTSLFTIRPYL